MHAEQGRRARGASMVRLDAEMALLWLALVRCTRFGERLAM